MNSLEILKTHLKSIGADGLCWSGHGNEGCGCGLDYLAPCREWIGDCVPARRIAVPPDDENECGFIYVPVEKEKGGIEPYTGEQS